MAIKQETKIVPLKKEKIKLTYQPCQLNAVDIFEGWVNVDGCLEIKGKTESAMISVRREMIIKHLQKIFDKSESDSLDHVYVDVSITEFSEIDSFKYSEGKSNKEKIMRCFIAYEFGEFNFNQN